jgi:hypothetical protein
MSMLSSRSRRWSVLLLWTLAVLLFLGALIAAIWWLPSELTRHPSAGLKPADRLGAENAARGTLVAALALVGAAALTARYTWRAAKVTLAGQELDRNRQEIDRRGQITDRYTKAIDHLGHDKTDVRIGGIYALERIARDSVTDHPAVIEVLAAFVREHSHERWEPAGAEPDAPDRHLTRPDVQSAIEVIGRRNADYDTRLINLVRVDLRNADLVLANLAGADLTGANLSRASLVSADLNGADLTEADLTEADLTGANIGFADLSRADLTGAKIDFTILAEPGKVPTSER